MPRPQLASSNGCRYEFTRFLLKCRDTTSGPSICRVGAGVTLDEFLRAASNRLFTPSPVVRTLLAIRLFVGRIFGWDREPTVTAWGTFATRLTDADRSKSPAPGGTQDGFFRVVYRFENEQLVELINRTAHAAALKRPDRDREWLSVLFDCLCPQCRSPYASLYGPDRSLSQTDRLSIALAYGSR